MKNFVVLLAIFSCVLTSEPNGFNENISWTDYSSAKSDSSKPTLVILHKSWCAACKSLKAKLADSEEFEKLSQQFSMVNIPESDNLHDLPEFNVDGAYIPRLFFLNSQGEIMSEITNENGNPKYQYYYYNADTVIESMKKVAKNLAKEEL